MKKKNTSAIKWMLGILVILMAVAYCTTQQMQSKGLKRTSPHFLIKNKELSTIIQFLQFLENMIGIKNQNNHVLPAMGHVQNRTTKNGTLPSETASNVGALQGTGLISGQGSNTAQKGNNAGNNTGNNPVINAESSSGLNTENNLEMNAENNPGNTPAGNSEINADQETGNIAENNSEISSENNPENNSGGNPENNAEINDENNPEYNAEINSEITLGSGSGNNSGSNSGNNTGSTTRNTNQSNLPTINPIPSDDAVSQSVAQQNQQNNSLAALVAANQALAAEAIKSAQATKYQTVTSDSIAPADTTPAPQDIVDKIKSAQLIQH